MENGNKTPNMVRITLHRPTASGGRAGFHKTAIAVDDAKKNAHAFAGDFIPSGREIDLPEGAVIVRKTPAGSARNEEFLWSWARVPPDGVSWLWSEPVNGRNFLTFRDAVKTAVQQENNRQELQEPWLTRPGETVPDPQAAPPKSASIHTGPQFFAALTASGTRIRLNPDAGRFVPDAENGCPETARDANRFLDALQARCPAALHLAWNGQTLTLQASRKAVFQAIFGLDEELIKKAALKTADNRRPANPKLQETIQQAAAEAPAAIERYRAETWQAAAANIASLNLKLYPHPLNDTRIVYI